jgi:hypothetical protein
MRGPAFFAYADNYLIDVKFGIIADRRILFDDRAILAWFDIDRLGWRSNTTG